MKYDVITADNWADLTSKVNERIHDGWKPIGGIAISKVDRMGIKELWAQAMVSTIEPVSILPKK